MKPTRFTAGFEPLEQREAPSAVSLAGRGNGTQLASNPIATGSYQTVTYIQGTTRALGSFTGELVINFAPNQYAVQSSNALIVTQSGSELLTANTGSFKIPRHGFDGTTGTLHFKVVAGTGTGALAGATGQGQLQVQKNVVFGNLNFTIKGTLRG